MNTDVHPLNPKAAVNRLDAPSFSANRRTPMKIAALTEAGVTSHRRTLVPHPTGSRSSRWTSPGRGSLRARRTPATVPPPGRDRRALQRPSPDRSEDRPGYYAYLRCSRPPRPRAAGRLLGRQCREGPAEQGYVGPHFYGTTTGSRGSGPTQRYFDKLAAYGGVISPDHSLYRNMPTARRINHTIRTSSLGAWLQAA